MIIEWTQTDSASDILPFKTEVIEESLNEITSHLLQKVMLYQSFKRCSNACNTFISWEICFCKNFKTSQYFCKTFSLSKERVEPALTSVPGG